MKKRHIFYRFSAMILSGKWIEMEGQVWLFLVFLFLHL